MSNILITILKDFITQFSGNLTSFLLRSQQIWEEFQDTFEHYLKTREEKSIKIKTARAK
ncbi:hypothetical protein QUB44_16920 [Microcoleus sp. AT3-D2]